MDSIQNCRIFSRRILVEAAADRECILCQRISDRGIAEPYRSGGPVGHTASPAGLSLSQFQTTLQWLTLNTNAS